LVENRDFFIPALHSAPPLGGPRRNISIPFGAGKLEWFDYPVVEKCWGYVQPFRHNTGVWQTDRQRDEQTSCNGIVRAMHTRRAVKTRGWIWMKFCVSTGVATCTNWWTFEPDPDTGTRFTPDFCISPRLLKNAWMDLDEMLRSTW